MANERRSSPYWKYFRIHAEDKKCAVCLLCIKKYSRGGSGKMAGTGALKNHLKHQHAEQYAAILAESQKQSSAKTVTPTEIASSGAWNLPLSETKKKAQCSSCLQSQSDALNQTTLKSRGSEVCSINDDSSTAPNLTASRPTESLQKQPSTSYSGSGVDITRRTYTVGTQTDKVVEEPEEEIQEAWNRLAASMGILAVELKKNKEMLVSAFRFHYKKEEHSKRYALNEDDVCKPIRIFCEAMKDFLKEIYVTSKTAPSTEDNASSTCKQEINIEDSVRQENDYNCKRIDTQAKRKRNAAESPEFGEASKDRANTFSSSNDAFRHMQKEDDCELYGRLLAKKLRRFSEIDKQETMYEIDGILLNRRRNCNNLASHHSCTDILAQEIQITKRSSSPYPLFVSPSSSSH